MSKRRTGFGLNLLAVMLIGIGVIVLVLHFTLSPTTLLPSSHPRALMTVSTLGTHDQDPGCPPTREWYQLCIEICHTWKSSARLVSGFPLLVTTSGTITAYEQGTRGGGKITYSPTELRSLLDEHSDYLHRKYLKGREDSLRPIRPPLWSSDSPLLGQMLEDGVSQRTSTGIIWPNAEATIRVLAPRPLTMVFGGVLIASGAWLWFRKVAPAQGHCPQCGYDLRATPNDKPCPECGCAAKPAGVTP